MHVRRGKGLMPGQPVDVSTPPWDVRTGDESREWSSDRRPISHHNDVACLESYAPRNEYRAENH